MSFFYVSEKDLAFATPCEKYQNLIEFWILREFLIDCRALTGKLFSLSDRSTHPFIGSSFTGSSAAKEEEEEAAKRSSRI